MLVRDVSSSILRDWKRSVLSWSPRSNRNGNVADRPEAKWAMKKGSLVFRGIYPVMWGFELTIIRIPIKQPCIMASKTVFLRSLNPLKGSLHHAKKVTLNHQGSINFQFDVRKKKLWVECCFSNAPPSKATTGRGTIGTLIASSRKLCANLGEARIWQNSKRHSGFYVGNNSFFILVTRGRQGSMSWGNS